MALEDLAAVAGGKRCGGRARVFLRSGQILCGVLELEGLAFTMSSGPAGVSWE